MADQHTQQKAQEGWLLKNFQMTGSAFGRGGFHFEIRRDCVFDDSCERDCRTSSAGIRIAFFIVDMWTQQHVRTQPSPLNSTPAAGVFILHHPGCDVARGSRSCPTVHGCPKREAAGGHHHNPHAHKVAQHVDAHVHMRNTFMVAVSNPLPPHLARTSVPTGDNPTTDHHTQDHWVTTTNGRDYHCRQTRLRDQSPELSCRTSTLTTRGRTRWIAKCWSSSTCRARKLLVVRTSDRMISARAGVGLRQQTRMTSTSAHESRKSSSYPRVMRRTVMLLKHLMETNDHFQRSRSSREPRRALTVVISTQHAGWKW